MTRCARNGGALNNIRSSCPAKAGHPVFQSHPKLSDMSRRTRSPAFAAISGVRNFVMVPRHDKSTLLHQRQRRLHSHPGGERRSNTTRCTAGVIGLLAFAIEQRHGSDDFMPARLTVDMFRLNIDAPVKVADPASATASASRWSRLNFSSSISMAHASCQLLQRISDAAGQSVVTVELGRAQARRHCGANPESRLGMNGEWSTRPITGHIGSLGPRRLSISRCASWSRACR